MSLKSTGCRSLCPISIALDMIGDSWSGLIVRDLMFKGARTFSEMRCEEERSASNILTARLAKLQEHGLLTRERDSGDRRRLIYRLTEKGFDLAPVLLELILWAAKHEKTAAPEHILKAIQNDRPGFIEGLRKQWAGSAPGYNSRARRAEPSQRRYPSKKRRV